MAALGFDRVGRAPVLPVLGLAVLLAGCSGAAAQPAAPEPGFGAVGSPTAPTPSTSAGARDDGAADGALTGEVDGTPAPAPAPPRELALPSGTTAPVRLADVAPSGELSVPDDSAELGWWVGGAPLGAGAGTTLVAGHVDTARFGLGVFAELADLASGDVVTVTDGLGTQHAYVVTEALQVEKTALPGELFDAAGPHRLALVTCGGPFDEQTRRYRDNVIVWAEPA
ncbi:MAG: class F sortase [Kineosporiaceae bacterium]